jgi:UDP-N-acetylmuramoylalanine--D-glutamate ligase
MKVAIAGYGVEGVANYAYWSKDLANDVTIVDEQEVPQQPLPGGVKTILGPDAFSQLDDFDLVVRTAGLAPYKLHTTAKIWSATNEFMTRCVAPVIGVTGTKGKGTTSSLIASILQAAGQKVWLVGNIGLASLDVLDQIQPEDIVVYELSSFQLWDLEKSPHVAVILYMEPDHQDVHRSMDEYVMAKANIHLFQTPDDICFYLPNNRFTQQIIDAKPENAYPYNTEITGVDYASVELNTFFVHRDGEVTEFSTDELKIPGHHNQENAVAAIDAALVFDVDDDAIVKGLNSFHGLPHRLKLVKEVNGVQYYDDSIATTPGSAIAALASFEQPKILILGGSSKGVDFSGLAQKITQTNTKHVILIGGEAPHIQNALEKAGYTNFTNLGHTTMHDIVALARDKATAGDIVILSPSCASFDMFKNYADRGDQFIAAVEAL